jgi:EmrB/QacA subfamily drug resistance transporter
LPLAGRAARPHGKYMAERGVPRPAPPAAAGGEPGDEGAARRWAVLAVVCAAQFLTILDLWVVNIALPTLQRDFAPATLPAVAWILDIYAIGLAGLLLPAGRAADRLGARRCFLAGLVIFGAASAACAAAPSLPVLIAARAVQAAGAAVLMPTSLGLALAVFPARQRGTAVGIWSAVAGAAGGSGPVLGGLLVGVSWRLIFLINVPLVVAALVAGVAVLPRPEVVRGAVRPRLDVAGALLALAAIGLVCLALTEAPNWPPGRTGGLLAAGLVLGAVFVAWIRRRRDPVLSPGLFAVRRFSAGAAGIVAYYTGFAALLLGTTLLLTQYWHFSVLSAALGIVPAPLTVALGAPFSGLVAARLGRRATVGAGAALFAASAAWPLAAAGPRPAYLAVVLPSMLAWGVANALIQPSLFAAADAVPRAELASGSAVLAMARQLGSALGVAVLVALLGPHPGPSLAGYDRVWILVLASAAATALAGLGAGGRRAAARDGDGTPRAAAGARA